ncbi:MAG: Cys regulon transcriptional activator CysB [uncultured Thiotrichaceae bacterium]|uniref:Cys regulon transcriptional activator CysB n=1 Tax=uncultured Thiotrichaceae bacterium TaxID=298394 RepID=A0A6S6U643_9GAMM|nr:MAG: Cys regulon transcriptional activator CysB [uncultured Thiotrichaceae bacterium]
MNLKQLTSLIAVAENNFSISHAAEQLHMVQSAVSQQISRLEEEIGTQIFIRKGKRLSGLSPAGEEIVHYAYRAIANTNSILEIGRDQINQVEGKLRIGATHTQAQYILPPVIKAFSQEYPNIELQIHQGSPKQLVNKAIHDEVDLSICTEALGEHPDLVSISSYRWNRVLIARPDHPILNLSLITLEQLCKHPIVTYVYGFTGREVFSDAFKQALLKPKIVLSAADTDVIKTYVRNGMGIGIIASMAYKKQHDSDLVFRDLSHLFPWETTKIAYQKDKYLRIHQQRFIELFQLTVSDLKAVSKPLGYQ